MRVKKQKGFYLVDESMSTQEEEKIFLFPHFKVTQNHTIAKQISGSKIKSAAGHGKMCLPQTADTAKLCVCYRNKHFSISAVSTNPRVLTASKVQLQDWICCCTYFACDSKTEMPDSRHAK